MKPQHLLPGFLVIVLLWVAVAALFSTGHPILGFILAVMNGANTLKGISLLSETLDRR